MNNPDATNIFTARDIVPVTPSDTVDLDISARSLRFAGGGTLRITTASGAVRNTTVIDAEILPVQVTRVHATGTTATGIEALI